MELAPPPPRLVHLTRRLARFGRPAPAALRPPDLEARLGIPLPAEYLAFLDATPHADLPGLIVLRPGGMLDLIAFQSAARALGMPDGLVVFATDEGGGLWCFDQRDPRSSGQVVLWQSALPPRANLALLTPSYACFCDWLEAELDLACLANG